MEPQYLSQIKYLLILIAGYLVYNIYLFVGLYFDMKENKIPNRFFWSLIVLAFGPVGIRFYEKANNLGNKKLTPSESLEVTETENNLAIDASKNKNKRLTIFLILFNAAWLGAIVLYLLWFLLIGNKIR